MPKLGERHRGYLDAIASAKAACHVVSIDITSGASYKSININYWLKKAYILTVLWHVVIWWHLAYESLKERYISIPNDVALVGFDDIAMADISHPSLSSIKQNTQRASSYSCGKINSAVFGANNHLSSC